MTDVVAKCTVALDFVLWVHLYLLHPFYIDLIQKILILTSASINKGYVFMTNSISTAAGSTPTAYLLYLYIWSLAYLVFTQNMRDRNCRSLHRTDSTRDHAHQFTVSRSI